MLPAYTALVGARVDAPRRPDCPSEKLGPCRGGEGIRRRHADASLPDRLPDGRPAFDESASRISMTFASCDRWRPRRDAGGTAPGSARGSLWALRGRRRRLARGAPCGGAWLARPHSSRSLLWRLTDFDDFFAGFHALFFEAGTWQFPGRCAAHPALPRAVLGHLGRRVGRTRAARRLLLGCGQTRRACTPDRGMTSAQARCTLLSSDISPRGVTGGRVAVRGGSQVR
jgi:hypothetical protein